MGSDNLIRSDRFGGGRLFPETPKEVDRGKPPGSSESKKGILFHSRVGSVFRKTIDVSLDIKGTGAPKTYYVNPESARKFFGDEQIAQEKQTQAKNARQSLEEMEKQGKTFIATCISSLIQKQILTLNEENPSDREPVRFIQDPQSCTSEVELPKTQPTPEKRSTGDKYNMGQGKSEDKKTTPPHTSTTKIQGDHNPKLEEENWPEELGEESEKEDLGDYFYEGWEEYDIEATPEETTQKTTVEDPEWLYTFETSTPVKSTSEAIPKTQPPPVDPRFVISPLPPERLNYHDMVDNWLKANKGKIKEEVLPETRSYLESRLKYDYEHLSYDPAKVMNTTSSQHALAINRLVPELKKQHLELCPAGELGDCFFDAVAQGLRRLGKLETQTGSLVDNIQELRAAACKTATSLRDALIGSQKKEGNESKSEEESAKRIANREVVDQFWKGHAISWKAFTEKFSDYNNIDDYIDRVPYQFTGGNTKDVDKARWGSPDLDARLLAKAYNVRIVAYNLPEDIPEGDPEGFSDMFLPDRIPDNDVEMDEIVIVNYRFHFVATRPISEQPPST